VHVRVDQSRQHRLASEIDPRRAGAGQPQDLGIAAHGKDPPVADRHRLHDPELGIDGHDLAVVEDLARRGRLLAAGRKHEDEWNNDDQADSLEKAELTAPDGDFRRDPNASMAHWRSPTPSRRGHTMSPLAAHVKSDSAQG
jgi:hypothetical protein